MMDTLQKFNKKKNLKNDFNLIMFFFLYILKKLFYFLIIIIELPLQFKNVFFGL
jgi:hypothetical protein